MSEAEGQLKPENLQREAWVKRVLRFDVRRRRVAATLGGAVSRTSEVEAGTDGPTRESLLRRLRALTAKAEAFAEIAPRGAYAAMYQKIAPIKGLVDAKKWVEAHKAITAVERQIDEETPGAEALRDFRGEVQAVTMKLDKAFPLLLPQDRVTYDNRLLGLERGTPPDGVESARVALRQAETDIERLAKEGEERKTRLELLHSQRLLVEGQTSNLAVRADELGLAELALKAADAARILTELAGSTDEAALAQAIRTAETLLKDSVEPLAKAEQTRREETMRDIGRRLEELLQAKQPVLDTAWALLLEPVEEGREALEERLKLAPDTDGVVQEAETSLDSLTKEIANVEHEMEKVAPLQGQIEARLLKYPSMKKPTVPDALDQYYDNLPKELKQDIGSAEWKKLDRWDDPGKWNAYGIFKVWSQRLSSDKKALNEQAYADAIAVKPNRCKPFLDLKRKMLPQHAKDGQAIVENIEHLLETAEEEQSLSETSVKTLNEYYDSLDELVEKAEQNIEDKKNKAQQIDAEDGAHTVARHGPDIDDQKLKKRLTTGRAPDGIFSPGAKSSRFNSYDDLIDTRETAFAEIAQSAGHSLASLFGADLDQPPNPNGRGALRFLYHIITHDHAPRVIGSGFVGTTVKETFASGGQTFSDFRAVPSLTKTFTKIIWDGGKSKWIAIQHFPTDL
jgi:hypothetical protein